MREYILVSDSTADLPIEVIDKYDIKIVPFSYSVNDEQKIYDINGNEDELKEFYTKLKRGAMPVTSQINPDTYRKIFDEIVKTGKDILYMSFSTGLSGTFQSAKIAADMVMDDNEGAVVRVVDTLSASVGQGVFVYAAAIKKQEGTSLDELADWVEKTRHNVRHWFMVEDLLHLKRGGRVTTVEAVMGSALKIKPILSVDDEGKLVVKSRARGNIKALEYLASKVGEEGGELGNLKAVIGHADSLEKAEKLKQIVIDLGMKEENIIISMIGPIIGAHVGQGMAAIAFIS